MRTNLKVFRVQNHLTQGEMADKIGVARATYTSVETGARAGRHYFWIALQKAFNIPDSDLWGLMKLDDE